MWKKNLLRLVDILLSRGGIKAALTWPVFSVTSFKMLSELKRLQVRPRTVIDVGANIGQFTMAAAKSFPGANVHSFEPLPDCVKRLRQNVRDLQNVTVHSVALGERESSCSMHVNAYKLSSSILPLTSAHRQAFPYAKEVDSFEVEVSTLDKTLENVPLQRPVLLKIDVQGYEERVLRGAVMTLMQVDYAVIEASTLPLYEGELLLDGLIGLMNRFGFSFQCPVGRLNHPSTGNVLQIDAFFSRTY
jgi:FkbM family methyltransferase